MVVVVLDRRRRWHTLLLTLLALFDSFRHWPALALARIDHPPPPPPPPSPFHFSTLPPSSPAVTDHPLISGPPVAFPIFRPPMVSSSVQHQRSAAENERSRDNLHINLLPRNFTTDKVASGMDMDTSSSGASPSSSSGTEEEEQEDAGSGGELAPMANRNESNSSSNNRTMGSLRRLHSFGPNSKANSTKLHRSPLTTSSSPTPLTSPFPTDRSSTTVASDGIMAQSSSAPSTPQFPVFTGMGMEIIDSNESDGSSSSRNTDGEQQDEEEEQRRKMHYERAEKGKGKKVIGSDQNNGRNGTKVIEPMLIISTMAPSTTADQDGIMTTVRTRISSSTLATSSGGGVFGRNGSGSDPTERTTTPVTAPADEVTDDLLAMFGTTRQPPPPNFGPKAEGSNDEFGEAFKQEEQAEEEQTTGRMGPKLPTMGPNEEEVIPRPTKTTTTTQQRLAEGNWLGQSKSNLTTPTMESSTTTTTTTTPQEMVTRFPLFTWTTSAESESVTSSSSRSSSSTTTKPTTETSTTDSTSTTPSPTTTSEEWVDRRITVGGWPKQQQQHASSTVDWFNNGIVEEAEEHGEEEEEREQNRVGTTTARTRTESESSTNGRRTTTTTTSPSSAWQQQRNNAPMGRGEDDGRRTVDGGGALSKKAAESIGASYRLGVMASIIAVLFVAVGIGSICTGRYVRKSRQLHGKYRPAAYEMQSTRPPAPPLSFPSSDPLPPPTDSYAAHAQMAPGAAGGCCSRDERLI